MGKSRVLADWVRAIERHETAVPERKAVHQMRVAARRLRATLRLLGLREVDPEVKRLQDALGDVRDLQLQVDWLKGRDDDLRRARQAELRKAEQGLERQLRAWRSRTLPALLEAAVDDSSPSARTAAKLLRRRLDRLERRLDRARSRLTPKVLHRARVSVKQVSYLLEVAKGVLPKKATSLQSDLKTLQASLGELHDVDVRIGLVKRNKALLRDQKDSRAQLSKIVAAQLRRWRKEKLAKRARKRL
jgi:CHAD domain-containing protein